MIKKVFFLVFSFLLLACDNEKPDIYLELSESQVISNCLGITKEIIVSTNSEWNISIYPEWCSIKKGKRNGKEVLTIDVQPNETVLIRKGDIAIEANGVTKHVQISQEGDLHKNMNWKTFPINSFTDIQYKKEANGEITYSIKGSKLFINSHICQNIYPGNLINNKSENIYTITDYQQYSFPEITVSANIVGKSYSYTTKHPSKEESDVLTKKIMATEGFQNLSFYSSDKPLIYNSYKELNLWGVGNLGVELDKLLSEKSYLDSEMKRQNGMIYSYCDELFSLVMDYPEKDKNSGIENELFYSNLAYINQITYGKTAFLIVETDSDIEKTKILIKGLMTDTSLDKNEQELIKDMDFYYLFFDADSQIHKLKGGSELVLKYKDSVNDNELIPLAFSLNNYKNYAISQLKFNLHLK